VIVTEMGKTHMNLQQVNEAWTDIYYLLHYKHKESLTHQNIRCLQTINKNKSITVQDIAKIMKISHNTASEHIKRLMDKGYITKYKNPSDRRVVYLELTSSGKTVLQQNTELDMEKLEIIFKKLNNEQQNQILNAFELLRKEAYHEFRA
jgi:MarR family transcriptional regulator, organic hydroperoxide resistance regulator